MRVIISPIGSFRGIYGSSSPARLHEARDHALGAEVTKRDSAHLELAVVGARPTRHGAAVTHAGARGIARKLGELERRRESILHRQRLVARDRLEPHPPPGKFLGELAPPLVLLDRTLLRHSFSPDLSASEVALRPITAGTGN